MNDQSNNFRTLVIALPVIALVIVLVMFIYMTTIEPQFQARDAAMQKCVQEQVHTYDECLKIAGWLGGE